MSKLGGTIFVFHRVIDAGFLDRLRTVIARNRLHDVDVQLVPVGDSLDRLSAEFQLGLDAWSGVMVLQGSINARYETFHDLLHDFAGNFYRQLPAAIRWGSARWCELQSAERWDGYETDVFADQNTPRDLGPLPA